MTAQDPVWPQVTAELAAGRKTSHWMWYIFPQLRVLGRSDRAKHYGLGGLDEARAYLAHALLRDRLDQVTSLMLGHKGQRAEDILGPVDALKFRPSMTLFDGVAPDGLYASALAAFCDGPCPVTRDVLSARS